MIVPATKKHLSAFTFARGNVKTGEDFSIDSGMGGSWQVAYVKHEGKRLLFRREARTDWPAEDFRFESDEDAARNLYLLIPDDSGQGY